MKKEFNKLPRPIRILNVLVLVVSYITIAISLAIQISPDENPFRLESWERDSLTLLAVFLFLIGPFFSLLIFGILLSFENFFVARSLMDWFFPKEGTLGNPTIDDVISDRGVKALNLLVKILIVFLVLAFAWIIYLALEKF